MVLLAVSFAIITGYFHHHIYVTQPNQLGVVEQHFDVVNGDAMAPTQYRPAPFLIADSIFKLLVMSGVANNSLNLIRTYTFIRLLLMALNYVLLLIFFRTWFDPVKSVLGLCFFVAVNPLAEYFYFHQPSDPWLLTFFLLGYLAIINIKDLLLPLVIFIAVPFKETIILLLPGYIAANWKNSSIARISIFSVFSMAGFAMPWLALRLIYGARES
jgi:hypothetical protein